VAATRSGSAAKRPVLRPPLNREAQQGRGRDAIRQRAPPAPPPTFGERRYRGFARRLAAVRRRPVFVVSECECPHTRRSHRRRCGIHDPRRTTAPSASTSKSSSSSSVIGRTNLSQAVVQKIPIACSLITKLKFVARTVHRRPARVFETSSPALTIIEWDGTDENSGMAQFAQWWGKSRWTSWPQTDTNALCARSGPVDSQHRRAMAHAAAELAELQNRASALSDLVPR
jgi:hypothetical protein